MSEQHLPPYKQLIEEQMGVLKSEIEEKQAQYSLYAQALAFLDNEEYLVKIASSDLAGGKEYYEQSKVVYERAVAQLPIPHSKTENYEKISTAVHFTKPEEIKDTSKVGEVPTELPEFNPPTSSVKFSRLEKRLIRVLIDARKERQTDRDDIADKLYPNVSDIKMRRSRMQSAMSRLRAKLHQTPVNIPYYHTPEERLRGYTAMYRINIPEGFNIDSLLGEVE